MICSCGAPMYHGANLCRQCYLVVVSRPDKRVCGACGGPKSRRAEGQLCRACTARRHGDKIRQWSPDEIVALMREWARHHDGDPPTGDEWKSTDGEWPSYATARRAFGSWNGAVRAAGLLPRKQGQVRAFIGPERVYVRNV